MRVVQYYHYKFVKANAVLLFLENCFLEIFKVKCPMVFLVGLQMFLDLPAAMKGIF